MHHFRLKFTLIHIGTKSVSKNKFNGGVNYNCSGPLLYVAGSF